MMNIRSGTLNALLATLLVVVVIPACGAGPGGSDGPPLHAETSPLSRVISTEQAKLLASDGAAFDTFGAAVALSGDTALVGARRDDDMGTDAGAVYVFVRSGTSWTQEAKLTAADGGANDEFGIAVALSGDTALVGAIFDDEVGSDAGAAYVFVRSGTSWTQEAKLTAADGGADDKFGIAVALSGDTALVGEPNDNPRGTHSGSAFVFVRSGASWTQEAKLTAADGAEFDEFGIAVALSGDTAVVGARLADARGEDSGAAYVFARGGTSWTQEAKLTAADGSSNDLFGTSVATSGDTALVGVPNESDLGAASGAAYVFVRSGTSWTQQAKLTATDGAASDLLGVSVAVSGDTALIGALGDDDLGSSSGAAYVYAPASSNHGDACAADADCGSGFCADGVCCDTACGGSDPDDCQACSIAAGAAVDGTCAPRSAGTVCREAAGACDVAESCTGGSVSCPADDFKPDLAPCDGGLLGLPGLCLAGACLL